MRRRYTITVCASCLDQITEEASFSCSCASAGEWIEVSLPVSAGKIRSLVFKAQVAAAKARMARTRERA